MKLLTAGLGIAFAAIALSSGSDAQSGERCPAITDASRAGLYVIYDERQTAVEGSEQSAQRRGDDNWDHLFFEVAFAAKKLGPRCGRIGWRVEPYGRAPVDAADFGGKFPSGVVDLSRTDSRDPFKGEIEIWVPDDGRAERPEQFRIVLANPLTGRPLAGVIGLYDDNRGVPVFRAPAASLLMRDRLIMTVEDAPEQRRRK